MARSLLFDLLFYAWTSVLAVLSVPLLLLPRNAVQPVRLLWARGVVALLAVTVGMRHRVLGRETLPAGPFIVASKHQSAWETLVFCTLLDRPVFVLKRELFLIPFFGWILARTGMIGVDRRAGPKALKGMIRDVRRALEDGRPVIVFPEGTRTAPGTSRPYRSGIAALYQAFQVPVVPVALNSGLFWPRRSIRKKPGTVTLAFLPPIAPGLDRHSFLARLRDAIEGASETLRDAPDDGLSPAPPPGKAAGARGRP